MSKLIASTYEVIGKLGSGGGAHVYLANHVRLNKKVALKADKRKITARPEALRREVDVLKNLSHTYIPQVYDFFIEGETVYTAMEYVDGESLDRSLERGETYSQAQVIQWAIQLLQALSYLHSPTHGDPPRGFVHSDIKPANIMRTPQNDIRLIDFNIALAIGEENIVGRSAGYASPEHYGLDFSSGQETETIKNTTNILDQGTETLTLNVTPSSSTRVVVPDARSDIYSVGATLYHLLSGERPRKNAVDVIPLSEERFSPQLCKIINKAMNPNPELRYQTADEMLYAFTHLHQNDSRSRWFRIGQVAVYALLSLVLVAGIATTFIGLKRLQTTESWLKYAEYSKNALAEGNRSLAVDYAMQAFPDKTTVATPQRIPEAQKSLTDALGVYDLSDGYKSTDVVELPSPLVNVAIAPDGNTAACLYSTSVAIIDTHNARIIKTLPTVPSASSEMVFLNDTTLIYAGADGVTAYDTATDTVLWAGRPGTAIALSADGRYVASVYRNETFAVVYDCATGEVVKEISFGEKYQKVLESDTLFFNPEDDIFALNGDGSLMAVSFFDGSIKVYDLENNKIFDIVGGNEGYYHVTGGFSGNYLAYTVRNDNLTKFCVHDTNDMKLLGQFTSESNAFSMDSTVQADENGIYLHSNNILVDFNPATRVQIPLVNNSGSIDRFAYDGTHALIAVDNDYIFFDDNAKMLSRVNLDVGYGCFALSNGIALIGGLDSAAVRIMEYEGHSELDMFTYDAMYKHSEARISADGTTLMLFNFYNFCLYDREGNMIVDVKLPNPDQIYDQQYRRRDNGSYLEVTYWDGRVVEYSAVDGAIVSESAVEPPARDIREIFHTDSLRIEASLHGTAVAYDIATGEKVADVSDEDRLVYATQVGEYIVAQYDTTTSYNYGLILNSKCVALAELPYVSDIWNGQLIFDYPNGKIRSADIYSLKELLAVAKTN